MTHSITFTGNEDTSLDQLHARIQETLVKAQEIGRVNSLEAYQAQMALKRTLEENWQHLTQTYHAIEVSLNQFPMLPSWEQVQWAQHMLALPQLVFLEIDTTGLERLDEIIRFTLIDTRGQVLEDCLIKPAMRELGPQASAINGIKPEQLRNAPSIAHAWERIQRALRGRMVLSFGLEWDLEQLHRAARLHRLAPLQIPGECLRQHATRYYRKEYGLKLAELCARVGAPLPEYPNQTSLDRARGQLAVLQAFAQAITNVRPSVVRPTEATFASDTVDDGDDDFDPFLDPENLP